MPLGPASERALAIGRRAFPWLIPAVAAYLRPQALALADPAPCSGLLEFIAIGSFLLAPYASVGFIFTILSAIAIVGAAAAFLQLAARATGRIVVAAAAALAIVLSPLFPAALAPPTAAGAFAALAALAVLAARPRAGSRRLSTKLALQGGSALLLAALIVPAWTLVAAAAAAAVAWIALAGAGPRRRTTLAVAPAAGIVVAAVAMLAAFPPGALSGSATWQAVTACVLPQAVFSFERLGGIARAAAWALGPLVIALAVLGAFTASHRRRSGDAAVVAGFVAALTLFGPATVAIASIPVVLAAWWLAALGLEQTIAAAGGGRSAASAGVIVLLLLPALQDARRRGEERDDLVSPSGHEQLSLQRMRGLLNMVADGGVVAREDTSVDLLLRAATAGRQRGLKRFVVISPEPGVVERARAAGPVFVFPRAQSELGDSAFVLAPVPAATRRRDRAWEEIQGLATVVGRRGCQRIQNEWVDLSDIAAGGRIAVVAESSTSVDDVSLLLGGANPPVLVPERWTPRMISGFRWSVFRRETTREAERLAAEGRALGVPADHPVLASTVLVRLMLNRIPRGPLTMPVALGGSFPVAIARLDPMISSEPLWVCDASASRVTPFEVRRSEIQR